MNQAMLPMMIGAAILALLTVLLQTHWVSRLWLRWIPRFIRDRISPHFNSRPAVHPSLPDPNLIQVDDDAPWLSKCGAYVQQTVLSAMHGIKDVDYYFSRIRIVVLFELFLLLTVVILLAVIASL